MNFLKKILHIDLNKIINNYNKDNNNIKISQHNNSSVILISHLKSLVAIILNNKYRIQQENKLLI